VPAVEALHDARDADSRQTATGEIGTDPGQQVLHNYLHSELLASVPASSPGHVASSLVAWE